MPAHTHLTFDEQLAAEAAFHGWPLDLKWSTQAQAMYHGILAQTQGRDIIEEAGGTPDESDDYFVGPPRVASAIDLWRRAMAICQVRNKQRAKHGFWSVQ